MIPFTYYLFEYILGVYTSLYIGKDNVSSEFLPFMMCIMFFVFCFIYYREFKQKADTERRENLIKISISQQAKEIENIKKSNHETRILRHDMRHLLNAIAMSIEYLAERLGEKKQFSIQDDLFILRVVIILH